MAFTVLSFATACLFSTFVLLAVHLLRHNPAFIKGFGVKAVVAGYALCIARMAFTPEFPFTQVWVAPDMVDRVYQACCLESVPVFSSSTSLAGAFGFLWLAVAGILLLVFAAQYMLGLRRISRYKANEDRQAVAVLGQVQAEYPRRVAAEVYVCPETTIPMGVGIFSKKILLPYGDYTDRELYHMVKHEYTHFYNRDLAVKFLVLLFCCVFWWNPAVYLLWKDVSQMLEIKCDLTVTQQYRRKEKKEYLSVIVGLLKEKEGRSPSGFTVGTGMLGRKKDHALIERFRAVMEPPKQVKRWVRVTAGVLFFALFLASYAVVIQPSYDPPIEEITEGGSAKEISSDGFYILKTGNNQYFSIWPGEKPCEMEKEIAELLAESGIEIREEQTK